MAEVLAVLGAVQSGISLISYCVKIVKRLDEYNQNVKGLPESFVKIRNQLPLLLKVVELLERQAGNGEFDIDTESLLVPVVSGLRKDIEDFYSILSKVLPSPDASKQERILKAIKSVNIQKQINEFRSSIQDYLNTLTAFQHTRHADSLRGLITTIEAQIERPARPPDYEVLDPCVQKPKPKPVWMVKYKLEEAFVGREGIMSPIEQQLTEGNHRAALAGIGGVGKSRIAIEYSYRHRQLHPDGHVFWVHGGSRSRFESDYRNIARLLDLRGREDPDVNALRLVTDWLSDEGNGSWLMILDNADDRDLWLGPQKKSAQEKTASVPLIHHLPRCVAGGLLVTTRDRQLGHQLLERKQQPLSISRLEPKDAQSLLTVKLSDQQLGPEGVEKLAEELEYLPLTITQAAAYLEQTEISASEYLELFRAGQSDIPNLLEESIYDSSRDHEGSNSVFQTWRLSFEQLATQNSKAADVLSLMAVLDRQAISSKLLQTPGGNVLDQKAAIAKLKAFSLIHEESASKKFALHRLVQLSTQRWLADHGKLSHWQKIAIGAVAREFPEETVFDQWVLIQDLSSHVHIVLAYSYSEPTLLADRAHILHSLGHYTMERGETEAALQMLLDSHRIREKHFGVEDERTLETLGLIGLAHSRLHQLTLAREVLEKFIESTNRVLGPRHRLTLKGKSRLAQCYNREGKLRQGKELSLQILQIVEEEFGSDSEDTLRLLTNLVYCCNKLRQWEEAEGIGRRVLKHRMEQHGMDHPDTLTIMSTLAWTYREQSRFQESREMDGQVLSRRHEILGPDHPKTRSTKEGLAESCGCLRDWEQARELQREVVEAKRQKFGAHHKATKRAEEYLRLLDADLSDESNEAAAIEWLTKGRGRLAKDPARDSTRTSGGNHRHTTNTSGHKRRDSVKYRANGSIASAPVSMSKKGMKPVTSPPGSQKSSSSHPELQNAQNNLTHTFQAIREAQWQLACLNQDLIHHIQEFARGNNTMTSADFALLRKDYRDFVYANLRRAQREHEEARERVRSFGNEGVEGRA